MGFLDMRQWMANLEQQGELRRIKAEVDWDREIGAITRRVLEKKGPALLFENIKGYEDGRCTKLFASGLGARSRLALALGFSQRRRQSRARPICDEEEPRDHPAGHGANRAGERGDPARQGHRPDRVSGAEMALSRRRPLHPHLHLHRHQGPGHRRDECRHVSRHDRAERHHAVSAHQRRPALGRAFREMGRARPADAGRLRDRLGSDHVVSVRLAAAGGRLRIRRDGRLSRRSRATCEMRDRRSRRAGQRRDRDRRNHQRRSVDLRDGRTVRRIHRLRVRPADAAADDEDQLHHPPQRPDLLRLAGRHAARLLQREQRDVVGAARRHRLEYPQRRRHSRHSRRLCAADHQRRQHPHPDQEALSGPAEADRGGALGQQRGDNTATST